MMTKQALLQRLRDSREYISGQELCEAFGVSRTAVWKRIKQLQEDGYVIEAVPNKGYRIRQTPNAVTAEEILSRIQTGWIARDVRYFPVIDSTNTAARRLGEENAPEGILVIADEQTAGKGRRGRSWATPPGTDIAMSVLLRPQLPPDRISMVTLVMGLAVTEAVRSLYGLEAGIKWPNDVVIGGKKLTGILTEMSAELQMVHYIVIGTGINTNSVSFPEELADKATSLRLELGHEICRAELVAAVMKSFEEAYELFLRGQDLSLLMERYNALLLNCGRGVRVLETGHEYTGTARGIDRLGQLLVECGGGEIRKVYAGEVSVRGIYGYL